MAFDPEVPGAFVRDDYFEQLARLRRDAPVAPYATGCYTVARHADVRTVSSDPATYSSARGVLVSDPLRNGGTVEGSVLHMDPPAHGPWRGLVARRFTPRAVDGLEARVRAVTRAVLDAVPRGETVDAVSAIAAPLPVLVIAELLGVGDTDQADFRRWSDATIESPDHPGSRLDDVRELTQFLVALVHDRRDAPRDDLATVIATAEVGGRPLRTREAATYIMSLLIAGNETTRHLISGALVAFDEHRDQRALLARERDRLADAVEECLRWVTPIQAFGRTVTRPTTLGGTPLAEGDFVVMLYASANRDESVYGATSERFDVTRRPPAPHVAFGFGEHLCLGAALARLEARVLLDELLDTFADYAVAGPPTWVSSTLVRGMATLPAVFE